MVRGNRAATPQSSTRWSRRRTFTVRRTLKTNMDFSLTVDQQAILDSVITLCADFDLDYWRRRDSDGGFPHDFHAAIAQAGYLGVAMPTDYGGGGVWGAAAALGWRISA